MENIICYLKEKYNPLSIIIYGSYADGTSDASSDFDALIISADDNIYHDTDTVFGVKLDVFVYPCSVVENAYELEQFVQIYDSYVAFDADNIGLNFKNKVVKYIDSKPLKSHEECLDSLMWCKKMLLRARRGDSEGNFRAHWLLVDTLEIACDILRQRYFGPKKSLKLLKANYPCLFEYYDKALSSFDILDIEDWINALSKYFEEN